MAGNLSGPARQERYAFRRGKQYAALCMTFSFLVIILLVALMAVLAGCTGKPSVEPVQANPQLTTAETLADPNSILIVCDEAYPPFEFEENGVPRGISVDLTREAIRRMGYNVTITPYSWTRAVEMVQTGQAHGIFSLFRSAERETWGVFPKEPVFIDRQYFYGIPGTVIQYDGTIGSLTNYTIGITRGYSYGDAFDEAVKNGTLRTEAVDSNTANIEKVENGRIDAFIDSQYATLYYLKQTGQTGKVTELALLREPELYLAFSRKKVDQDFVDRYDHVMREMREDGTYDAIVNKYDVYLK